MALQIEVNERNGCEVIAAQGEVDLYSSPDLRNAILKTIAKSRNGTVAIDLAEVAYMDSSGVATLVEGLQQSQKKKKTFCLLTPARSVMKVLELARLDSIFDVRESL